MQKRVENIFLKARNKRGEILVENVIFIVLNIIFISILALFVVKQSSGAVILEQTSAKNIALVLDSAKPVTIISIDMSKQKSVSDSNKIPFGDIVKINGNVVSVKLSDRTGYEYSFFNDVDVSFHPETDSNYEFTGNYIFIINDKKLKK